MIILRNKPILSNLRQIGLLENSLEILRAVMPKFEDTPIDLLVPDLTAALDNIRDILGHKSKLEMVDEIFSRFCLGK